MCQMNQMNCIFRCGVVHKIDPFILIIHNVTVPLKVSFAIL